MSAILILWPPIETTKGLVTYGCIIKSKNSKGENTKMRSDTDNETAAQKFAFRNGQKQGSTHQKEQK